MNGIFLNNYFTPDIAESKEHDLVSDLIAEAIEITGVQALYLPFEESFIDLVLSEAITRTYETGYNVPVYVKTFIDNDGSNDLMTKFGIMHNDDYDFILSRQHFDLLNIPNRLEKPLAGDLLYIPLTNTLYSINNVPHRSKLSQLGKQFIWLLQTSPYSPQSDNIQINDVDVDYVGDADQFIEDMINRNENETSGEIGEIHTIDNNDPFGGY